ncbi:hypothetical protein RSB1_gp46 [Ralstonia phage RSB1]|uniref:Uncharacterized protein n=1 Tax=Ralstonia phage RSB1 TaxID=551790 RepID=B5BTY2_9CAUD|nr:hypothetical protein RSB1_gp46 [Ralstonia phage RSB1]BAG70404.1 hypothetical protein [Ralstonia phage RSB1]
MSHFSERVHHTRSFLDQYARVKVDQGSTDFFLGREFRTYFEIIKAASWTTFWLRAEATAPFNLQSQRVTLDVGAARISVWRNATPAGSWTDVPLFGRNLFPDTPVVTPTFKLQSGGTFSGGTESDLLRIRCGTNQGNQSSSNVGDDIDTRFLPAGTYAIKIEPITGLANTDGLNGKIELLWAERPQGNVG